MRAPRILQPGEGETVKLGPPSSAQFAITVDPQRDGTAFAMGTLTLSPGGSVPALRQLERELVLVVQKGQGRATVAGQSKTVLPGMAVTVPRGVWHDLRNTGTGVFQCVWVSAPPGFEAYVRELAQTGAAGAQDIARRHGVEFREAGPAAPAATTGVAPPASAPPGGQGRRPGRRRRRGGKGRRRASTAVQQAPTPAAPAPVARPSAPVPSAASPAGAKPPPRKSESPAGSRPRRGRRYGRVKEVYMEGRWVRLTGEGPVIST